MGTLMYPNHSYAGYQTNAIGVWNQTSVSQNPQGMGYALPFVRPEMATYVEKAPFTGAYPAISFGATEGDFYQQHYANINSQPTQWTPSAFQQYMLTPQYHRTAAV
ncbi:hypothetical protein OESDEN_05976 [Oesophagostomum dentatum]|uniref:Uncharacterized protein n=1 Tax=Oesophagostomum dentatum TaxID=61180 RepID=A0A0B1TE62_OESDE|nr:hypothetical protein OESDEN_05976 [Oesophagostomum dentatum]